MRKRYDVIIIGAGAAGMTAAIFAGRQGGRVCVIEHKAEPGRKILQTGNGRCNLTHEGVSASDYPYSGSKRAFLEESLGRFGYKETIEFFTSIGIPVRNKGGYIYPYSGTALSVRNALWDEMKRIGADIFTETRADISLEKDRFFVNAITSGKQDGRVREEKNELVGRSLILATGLRAAPKTGSDGSGIAVAEGLGLKINPVLPALVKLKCAGASSGVASGVRHVSNVQLYVDGKSVAQDRGEVQFTDDGISGIPVFNVSRYACDGLYEGHKVKLILDLLPDFSKEECLEYTDRFFDSMRSRRLTSFFGGMLPGKLIASLCRDLSISCDRCAEEIGRARLAEFISLCKSWELDVTGAYGFDYAQVCRGGVDTARLDPETMMSNVIPGLYVAGELADIDGPCGGYNLQWSWTSGALSGISAIR